MLRPWERYEREWWKFYWHVEEGNKRMFAPSILFYTSEVQWLFSKDDWVVSMEGTRWRWAVHVLYLTSLFKQWRGLVFFFFQWLSWWFKVPGVDVGFLLFWSQSGVCNVFKRLWWFDTPLNMCLITWTKDFENISFLVGPFLVTLFITWRE
jgi:hypothetical protein